MVVDINNEKWISTFRDTLRREVSMRLNMYGLRRGDIEDIVNYMVDAVNGEFVEARLLNSTFHRALEDLGINRRNTFPFTSFSAEESIERRASL